MPISSLIPVAAWLWDKYGKTLTDKTADAVKGGWAKFKWKDAAEAYRAKIKKLYGTMQIMGMAEPVPLDDIFTDVYMLDRPTAFGRFDLERLKQLSADPDAAPPQAKRINGLRLVNEKDNLFILGKPGAGKTTFLKYIALQATEQNVNKIPIFVTLKHWADSGLELMPFITERFDICAFPDALPFVEELLRSGNAIVLFDGLDEVNQESGQRDQQTRAMKNFIERYDRTQCLITCRIAANDYFFEPINYVEIADFSKEQIRTFAGNWFREDRKTGDRFLTAFEKDENKGLHDLARNPLLLTLLCLAFSEMLTFPQRRAMLYKEALDALLKKWDSSRGVHRDEVYRMLALDDKINMLACIAAKTFEKNEYFISQPELERRITDYVKNVLPHDTNEATNGEAILKAIEAQHGIFVERAREVYSFSHLTFQEYFTAKDIVTNTEKGALTKLVKEHCADRRWREVFRLTTSLLQDAGQFMTTFRRGVDELLGGDAKLRALLERVDKNSTPIRLGGAVDDQAEPWFARQRYLFIELYCERRRYERALALGLALDFHFMSTLEISTNRDLNLDLALASALELAIDRDPNRRASTSILLGRRRLTYWCSLARTFASDLKLYKLRQELIALSSSPGEITDEEWQKFTDEEWQKFTDKLRALMIKHRDIGHELNLTEAQEARLADYFNATYLLEDCLELAVIPPDEKKAMLNSLYLPPPKAAT